VTDEGLAWTVVWENELKPGDHGDISALLASAFPGTVRRFSHSRSWVGARPELRVLARGTGGVVAHAGVLRRFLRVADRDQMVGEVGLVAVHPSRQRRGAGRELLVRLEAVLKGLQVPFGFLNCRPELVRFYASGGWSRLPAVRTRYIEVSYPWQAVTLDYPALVLPVTARFEKWPVGEVVERNGWET
jgi:nodulation protein A